MSIPYQNIIVKWLENALGEKVIVESKTTFSSYIRFRTKNHGIYLWATNTKKLKSLGGEIKMIVWEGEDFFEKFGGEKLWLPEKQNYKTIPIDILEMEVEVTINEEYKY